ncbi:MAG: adenylate/guanylate cyclase domain-containing protein [Candidatus Eremiobacteraeota bacterium]|nr:adenylate/guanylate cyclase domain-containing protein [Candidatus Eremiobacteraeota bacterium]
MSNPVTRYAKSGDVNIAYQVVGDGPLDLVWVPGWVSNIEYAWEEPLIRRFLERLASFSRLIVFDKRGTGLSDRVPDDQLPTLEQRMDDVRAVMDAAGSQRAAVFGNSEGSVMSMLFAATFPQRTIALVIYGGFARRMWSEDYPWAPKPEERQKFFKMIEQGWGGVVDLATLAPSVAGDPRFQERWATYLRRSASPRAALALAKMNTNVDVRRVLPAIHVPTLVMHRTGDLDVNIAEARYIAQHIPGAKFVELPGVDHLFYAGDFDNVLGEVEEFLTGVRHAPEHDRILATVLFTDIVDSTRTGAEIGDRRWRDLLDGHNRLVRREIGRFSGREIKTTGDGFLATFDGPARAVRCALASCSDVKELGIEIRAGLHTGECEVIGDDVGGVAVNIAARVMDEAMPSEVLVSSTVRDLVAGSGLHFDSRGKQALKGVPGEWELLVAEGA